MAPGLAVGSTAAADVPSETATLEPDEEAADFPPEGSLTPGEWIRRVWGPPTPPSPLFSPSMPPVDVVPDDIDNHNDNEQLSLVQTALVTRQPVERFGRVLALIQDSLDKRGDDAALCAQELLRRVVNLRLSSDVAHTGIREEHFRSLEALLTSYGATPQSVTMVSGSSSSSMAPCPAVPPPAAVAWADDQLPVLTMFLLHRTFGVDDGCEPESQSSVEMMAACQVCERGEWRKATDAEWNEIAHHDQLMSQVQLEEDRRDAERLRQLQSQREEEERRRQLEAAEAQTWDRRTVVQELGTWPVRATKKMRMSYTVRQDDGQIVGRGSCDITAAAASRRVSITNHFADLPGGPVPTTAQHLQNQVEPDVDAEVGSQPHDAAVLLASQDLQLQQPENLVAPVIEGFPAEVVASYYRLFLDRALADELVEERFGESTLALFRQHRLECERGLPMLQDLFARPQLWEDFERWHRGAVDDAQIVELYRDEVLHQFQLEQRFQGGHTPPMAPGETSVTALDTDDAAEDAAAARPPSRTRRG